MLRRNELLTAIVGEKIKKNEKNIWKNYPTSHWSIPSITFRMVAQLAREFY